MAGSYSGQLRLIFDPCLQAGEDGREERKRNGGADRRLTIPKVGSGKSNTPTIPQ
jgi:hypothetical protein